MLSNFMKKPFHLGERALIKLEAAKYLPREAFYEEESQIFFPLAELILSPLPW
jgi:hypothetical protein